MQTKVFKASWIIGLIVGLLGVLGGLIMIFSPQFFMSDEMKGYLGQTWSGFASSNPLILTYFSHDIRLLGFTQFSLSVVGVLITWFFYRKRVKVAWWIALVTTIFVLVPNVALNIPIGDMIVVGFTGLMLVADVISLALGIKPVLMQS